MPAPPPSLDVLSALVASHSSITRRLEIYEPDNETLWGAIDQSVSRITDGSVSVDATRDERRDIDITLDNTDGLMSPNPSDGFWYDKILVPYRGVVTSSGTWEVPLGRFQIDTMNADQFPHLIKVTGRDFTKKMILSLFDTTDTFVAGTDVSDLVSALCANSGITSFSFPYDGTVTTADYTFDQGTSRWDAAKQVATDYNYDLYMDNTATATMSTKVDPTTSPITFTFKTGSTDGNLAAINEQVDDTNLFNRVIVIGGSSDSSTPPVYAEVVNDDPLSPTSIQKIGDRYMPPYTSENLTTTDQCLALATSILKVSALETYSLSISSIVFPWLEANTVVKILNPNAFPGDPENYLMDTFSVPLTLAAMPATGKRITIVGANTP